MSDIAAVLSYLWLLFLCLPFLSRFSSACHCAQAIEYDLVGCIPTDELLKAEQA